MIRKVLPFKNFPHAAAIAIPLVKIAVTVAAVAVVGYGLYNLYKTFTGGTVKDILPDPTDIDKK